MADFKAYWISRQPRERWMLGGGAVVAALLIGYLLVWEPMQESRVRLHETTPKLRAQAAQFRADADEAEALRATTKSQAPGAPLQTLIDESAKAAGIRASIKQVSALSNDRAQLSFGSVAFDQLTRWLAGLAQSDAVAVESIQLANASEAGKVQVDSLVLLRARAP